MVCGTATEGMWKMGLDKTKCVLARVCLNSVSFYHKAYIQSMCT